LNAPFLFSAAVYSAWFGGVVERMDAHFAPPAASISARMSSTRQAVVLGDSLIGGGKRPDLTPASQVDLLTGITAGIFFDGSPTIWYSLRNPVSGIWCIAFSSVHRNSDKCYIVLILYFAVRQKLFAGGKLIFRIDE
jgi:hypothetical protein